MSNQTASSTSSASQPPRSTPLRIGLTGGIGSGKTRVADQLAVLGASIIDTDLIAHALTQPGGPAIGPIYALFGEKVIADDGSLNRDVMRDLVFKNPAARARLEGLLHPMIGSEVQLQAARAHGLYQVFVVPLLVESGRWSSRVDRICVVDCDEETQITRVVQRNHHSREDVLRIMQAQATRQQRLDAADDVIINDGNTSLEQLRERVEQMHQKWLALAKAKSSL